jgi:hypothetical protein
MLPSWRPDLSANSQVDAGSGQSVRTCSHGDLWLEHPEDTFEVLRLDVDPTRERVVPSISDEEAK